MPYQAADPTHPDAREGRMTLPNSRDLPADELGGLIQSLSDEMHQAASDLRFEYAARLRDEIGELKRELRGMTAAT
jgi:excinuclease ABC subunit B